MKVFKQSHAAYKAAKSEQPVFRFGKLYFVIEEGEEVPSYTSFEIHGPAGAWGQREIIGSVGVGHLERLGNANHAVADPAWKGKGTIWNTPKVKP